MHWFTRICVLILLGLPISAISYPHYGFYHPHRTLMYFTPTEDDKSKTFQQLMLIHGCQMDERDLHSLVLDMGTMTDSRGLFSSKEINNLLVRFQIANHEHIAVLIGKDGTEKYRWERDVDINELVNVIDEMPMRQKEIEKRGMRCSI
ncbi:DUF4174 domain-containing protein [Enterovibrio sp. ZSDZ35]|uniref:DUF4174 domain-containing protein n=1 Tax=Enterovibrio qingdaonensis TaxID=2899818 RepID=A0ABT5QHQ0_9GAMM|nr:DUF4174 domain-containing protein [Enterovibrio sp. ZSDZ35]MDD1780516.1 DUF4174 domain-containing protein [Enterovibrio sp. ZSDZ35]